MLTILKTEADYREALKIVEWLIEFDPKKDTFLADQLELLVVVIQEYESKNYPMEMPPPIDALRFSIEQSGCSDAEFARRIGMQRSHFSEIMTGKKRMSLNAIRKAVALGIPANVLLQPFPCEIIR